MSAALDSSSGASASTHIWAAAASSEKSAFARWRSRTLLELSGSTVLANFSTLRTARPRPLPARTASLVPRRGGALRAKRRRPQTCSSARSRGLAGRRASRPSALPPRAPTGRAARRPVPVPRGTASAGAANGASTRSPSGDPLHGSSAARNRPIASAVRPPAWARSAALTSARDFERSSCSGSTSSA